MLEEAELANDDDQETQQKLLLKLYLNRGQSYIKIHWAKKACIDLKKALELEHNNPKANYHMGKAKRMLNNTDDALR